MAAKRIFLRRPAGRVLMVSLMIIIASSCASNKTDEIGSALDASAEARRAAQLQLLTLTRECMAESGFEYEPPQGAIDLMSTISAQTDPDLYETPILMSNRSEWKSKGYGVVSLIIATPIVFSVNEYAAQQGPEFVDALYGSVSSAGGCQQKAVQQTPVIRDLREFSRRAGEIEISVLAQLSGRSETLDWVRCMQDLGFPIDGLDGPVGLIQGEIERTLEGVELSLETVEFDRSSEQFSSQNTETHAKLSELYDFERLVATADFDCSENDLYEIAQQVLLVEQG